MARVVGVDLPREKRVEAGLQSIYGIGLTRARQLLEKTGINPDTRVRDLTDEEANLLSSTIQTIYKVEGDLRREVSANVKRLMRSTATAASATNAGFPFGGSARARTRAPGRARAASRSRRNNDRTSNPEARGGLVTWRKKNERPRTRSAVSP